MMEVERFELVEKVAECIFMRVSAQIAGSKADHGIWEGAYMIFKRGTMPMPLVEFSLDLAKMVIDIVEEDILKN